MAAITNAAVNLLVFILRNRFAALRGSPADYRIPAPAVSGRCRGGVTANSSLAEATRDKAPLADLTDGRHRCYSPPATCRSAITTVVSDEGRRKGSRHAEPAIQRGA
jgi:hypothetical protein